MVQLMMMMIAYVVAFDAYGNEQQEEAVKDADHQQQTQAGPGIRATTISLQHLYDCISVPLSRCMFHSSSSGFHDYTWNTTIPLIPS